MNKEIKVGDYVKPQFYEMKKGHISIQEKNYPWLVVMVKGDIIGIERVSKKSGKAHRETFHKDFLIVVPKEASKP